MLYDCYKKQCIDEVYLNVISGNGEQSYLFIYCITLQHKNICAMFLLTNVLVDLSIIIVVGASFPLTID